MSRHLRLLRRAIVVVALVGPLWVAGTIIYNTSLRAEIAGASGQGLLRLIVGAEPEGLFNAQQQEVFVWRGGKTQEVWLTLRPGRYFLVTEMRRCFAEGDIVVVRGKVTDWVFAPLGATMPTGIRETCFPKP